MFELTVETTFAAAHAIVIAGVREPIHGHNWHITATVAGEALDPDGLLVDFHAVQAMLDDITAPFRNANLNTTPPFDGINPTAENLALHIANALARRLAAAGFGPHDDPLDAFADDPADARARPSLLEPPGPEPVARVQALRVTEAPGCAVVYRPPRSCPAPITGPTEERP